MRDTLIRARGNKSQIEVAKTLGISQKYLSKLELEKRNPSMVLASKIAKYYGQSVEKFFCKKILQNGVIAKIKMLYENTMNRNMHQLTKSNKVA